MVHLVSAYSRGSLIVYDQFYNIIRLLKYIDVFI